MTLGFKGLGLKQMAAYKHQVPQGFILTTELFSAMPAMAHRPLFDDTRRAGAQGHRRPGEGDRAAAWAIPAGC